MFDISTNSLVALATVNVNNEYFSCSGKQITDTSKQTCDKYSSFSFTPQDALPLGTYFVTITGKDNAGNTSGETTFTLTVTTLSQITTPQEKTLITNETQNLTPQQKKEVEKKLVITKPTQAPKPNVATQVAGNVFNAGKNALSTIGSSLTYVFSGIGNGIGFVVHTTGDGISYVNQGIGNGIGAVINKTGEGLSFAGNVVGTGLAKTGGTIGTGYVAIEQQAPGVTKTLLQGIGNGVKSTGDFIRSNADNEGKGILSTGQVIAGTVNNTTQGTKNVIVNLSFAVGETTQNVSQNIGNAFFKLGYLFTPVPTRISDVKVAVLSPTTARISWYTNHPATGKVNYGLDETYPYETQTDKRTNDHSFTLTNLKPGTEYSFEVMSQNQNYVYDANRKFKTQKK